MLCQTIWRLTFLAVGLIALCCSAAERPNMILILADDMGYADCGVHGCTDFATPHLDSIAHSGVRFTQGYVTAPVCSPSRAGLLTGRYQQRFGHELNLGDGRNRNPLLGLPISEVTLAQRLKDVGYATGLVGKWHLGNLPPFHPNTRGFDEFFGFLMGQHGYFPGPLKERESPIQRNDTIVDESEYLTTAFGREAVAFVTAHRSEPFFLYLAFNAPHVPLDATDDHLARVGNLVGNRQRYAALMVAMDDAIGKLLNQLAELQLEPNTIVAFLSDNGGPPGNGSDNGILRGHKAKTFEGGIRVPYFLKWPAKIPAKQVIEEPVISLDLMPTLLAAAQVAVSPEWKLDGENLLPICTGEAPRLPRQHLYWRFGNHRAIRHRDWKLVQSSGLDAQLFRLASDRAEANDLHSSEAERFQEMEGQWQSWNQQLIAPLWGTRD